MLGQNPSDFSKIQVVSFKNHEISLNPSVFSLNPSDLQTPPHPPGGYVEMRGILGFNISLGFNKPYDRMYIVARFSLND